MMPPDSRAAAAVQPRAMSTRLSSIAGHHLSLECVCGRHELLPVADVLAKHGDLSLEVMRRRLWCSRCGLRGVTELRIIHAAPEAPLRDAPD